MELVYRNPPADLIDLIEWHLRSNVAVSFIDHCPEFMVASIDIGHEPQALDITVFGGPKEMVRLGPDIRIVTIYGKA